MHPVSIPRLVLAFVMIAVAVASSGGEEGTVKVTPLGSRTGEFCGLDRALLFEDPTGVRILYDPGNTIAGGTDARLGDVHAILISHAHGDHLGSNRMSHDPDASTAPCTFGFPGTPATPHSNTAHIAAAKNSAVVAGLLTSFLGFRIGQLRGAPTPGCPAAGPTNEFTVPREAPCAAVLGMGAKRTIRHASATQGVQVAAVTAEHHNDLAPAFLDEPERSDLSANAISAYGGTANGFVVTFTNGLTVYLSGDTGLTGDMRTVVNGFYGANLAVLNIGDVFTTGPEEGAFAVRSLVRAKAVIPSHVNEVATTGGAVNPGTRTARFIDLVGRTRVHVPLSGVTMEFDGDARCHAGCN